MEDLERVLRPIKTPSVSEWLEHKKRISDPKTELPSGDVVLSHARGPCGGPRVVLTREEWERHYVPLAEKCKLNPHNDGSGEDLVAFRDLLKSVKPPKWQQVVDLMRAALGLDIAV